MPIPYILLYLLLSYTAGQGLGRENLPYYTEVPSTSFRCEDQQFAGYYSDPEAECQLFHICVRHNNNILEQYSFLCPNETVFDQENMVCVWWDGFECSTASSLYYVNQDIFEDSQEDERGKQFFDDERLDQERFLRRPRGRGAFQKGSQSTSSKTLIEDISARNALGKSFTSDVRSPTQNTGGFSKDVGKATKVAKLPIINSIGSAKSENLLYRSPDKLTSAKSFHFTTSGKSKKRPLSLLTKQELNDRSKTTNRNLNGKQLTNSIAILPFTQLTSPFQISVPVGKPKLETSITNHSFTKSNSDKKFKFNSTKELKSTSAPSLYNKQVPTEKRADISSKKEKKLSKNSISEQFPNFGNLKKDQINSNTRRLSSNYVQTKYISRVSDSKAPHKKLSKEKTKQTLTTSQPPRSYLPTTRTTSPPNRRIKNPVSKGKEKSFSRNKSRGVKAFRSTVSKGISSYDILHQLLKNVTVIRSEKIAKLNKGFGRSFKRNKRLNKGHFNSDAKFQDKVLPTIDSIKLADNSGQIEKKISTNFLKSASNKCIFDGKTKTFTGCSSKVLSDETKHENIKNNKEPSSNAEISSYLFHSSTNSAAEKTITSPTLQKVRTFKKGLLSRGKKKFSVDKFFDPMKLGFNQLSKK